MKAVGLHKYLEISNPESLIDVEVPDPQKPEGHDILVKIKAISVNPVDTKVRAPKDKVEKEPKVLGWDAAGIVEDVGDDVTLFKKSDEVYYSGSIIRPGSNSEFQLVDERIVGNKPSSLSFEEAAALPLTTITAWEAMFEHMHITPGEPESSKGRSILIIGGAGGVGSIAIQLAKKLTGLTVIATASREATQNWCLDLGADHVINHRNDLSDELKKIDIPEINYVFCLHDTATYFNNTVDLLKPFGVFCSIVSLEEGELLDINRLKNKCGSFAWEFMFTKSTYQTDDMQSQHDLLNEVARLVDQGEIETTMNEQYGQLNAENLRKAHAQLESGTTIGKIVLSGIE